jgi:peroxiredoxin Q/BCP
LLAIYLSAGGNGAGKASGSRAAGAYTFRVGKPGPGDTAPNLRLASTAGGTFDLAAQRGHTTLLYFQEGLTCQPCWDQISDIQKHAAAFKAAGVDQIVSITTDPLSDLRQKVADDGLTTPVLSDPNLEVSKAYDANSYGMMGDSRDGHSFVLVDGQGKVVWRADYGGAPDFTMYVPPSNLLADLRKGTAGLSPTTVP